MRFLRLRCSSSVETVCFVAEYILYAKKSKYRKRLQLFITIIYKIFHHSPILSFFDPLPSRLGGRAIATRPARWQWAEPSPRLYEPSMARRSSQLGSIQPSQWV